MSWYLFTANHTAHIQPTLTSGTEIAGYPVGLCRTPAINVRSQIAGDVADGVQIDWDRGTADGAAVDSVLIMANMMTTSTLDILGDTVATFDSPATTLLTTSTHKIPDFFRRLSSTSTERYLRFDYQNTSGGTFKYGMIAIGRSYILPNPQIATESHGADGDQRIRTQSFRMVSKANAQAINEHMGRHYIWTGASQSKNLIDGIGGKQTPIALIDDGGAAGSETVYYGHATVTARPSMANFYEVTIRMNVVRQGVFL